MGKFWQTTWQFWIGAVVSGTLVGLWTYSQLYPYSVGRCHDVPLTTGPVATVRDCHGLGWTEFAVPVGVIAIAVLLLSDAAIKIGAGGVTLERGARSSAREGVATLTQAPPAVRAQEVEAFLEDLP